MVPVIRPRKFFHWSLVLDDAKPLPDDEDEDSQSCNKGSYSSRAPTIFGSEDSSSEEEVENVMSYTEISDCVEFEMVNDELVCKSKRDIVVDAAICHRFYGDATENHVCGIASSADPTSSDEEEEIARGRCILGFSARNGRQSQKWEFESCKYSKFSLKLKFLLALNPNECDV